MKFTKRFFHHAWLLPLALISLSSPHTRAEDSKSTATAAAKQPKVEPAADLNAPLRFEYRAPNPGARVSLAADFLRWDSERFVFTEIEPGRHVLEIPRPWVQTLEYKLVVDGKWIRDPANPKSVSDGFGGSNSLIDDIGFNEDEWLAPLTPGEPRWRTFRYQFADYEGVPRMVTVLHPPLSLVRTRNAANSGSATTVTVYFQDGSDYLDLAAAKNFLSRLAQNHPELPLVTGVFIPPRERMKEYGLSERSRAYGNFLADKVVPAIEGLHATGGAPLRRMLIGPSLGGLVTLETGLRHPDRFGLVASQSGSMWFEDGKILDLMTAGSGAGQHYFLEIGLFETETMLVWNRKVRDRARALDWDFDYREYPSVHNWSAWRNRLREIFVTLLPHAE